MTRKRPKSPALRHVPKRYYGVDIPLRVIRRYAQQIAETFHPEKIILFGSRAYGTPHEDSDVDLFVVMPARDELYEAFRIRMAVPAPFPMDLLVRRPDRGRCEIRRPTTRRAGARARCRPRRR